MRQIVRHMARAFHHLGQAFTRLSEHLDLWLANHPKKEDDEK